MNFVIFVSLTQWNHQRLDRDWARVQCSQCALKKEGPKCDCIAASQGDKNLTLRIEKFCVCRSSWFFMFWDCIERSSSSSLLVFGWVIVVLQWVSLYIFLNRHKLLRHSSLYLTTILSLYLWCLWHYIAATAELASPYRKLPSLLFITRKEYDYCWSWCRFRLRDGIHLQINRLRRYLHYCYIP